jgi:predicted transcriptional regulator
MEGPMLSNKIKEIMNLDIMTVQPADSIAAVMKQMEEKNVGRVIVTEKIPNIHYRYEDRINLYQKRPD